MNKTLLVGIGLVVIAAAGYWNISDLSGGSPEGAADVAAQPVAQQPTASQAMPVPAEGTAPVTETVVNPPAAGEPEPAPSYFTVADVATHNSYSDCWIIVQGKVFDMTGFDSIHPGGSEAIMKLCGKDGTRKFMGEDEHAERNAWKEIQQFKVGELRG